MVLDPKQQVPSESAPGGLVVNSHSVLTVGAWLDTPGSIQLKAPKNRRDSNLQLLVF